MALRTLIAVAALLAAAMFVPARAGHAQPVLQKPDVPFVTVRNRTGSDDPARFFGDDRSRPSTGICTVRARDFGAFVPLVEAVPGYIREEFLRVETLRLVPREALRAGDDAPRVLYVHGYNMSFEKGCRRAVLLQENARLAGKLLWFSWPSDGALTNYTHDESDLYWSVPDIAQTILDMEDAAGAPLDLVAHSLGARGLMLALMDVAARRPDARLGEIVLLAPDVDAQIFRRVLPRIAPMAQAVTIYVNAADRPLALSAQLHGYARLGEAGNDLTGLDGVEVIDVSALEVADPTGHLYHLFSAEVGADLDALLNHRRRAAARQGLAQAGANLWRVQPGAAIPAK